MVIYIKNMVCDRCKMAVKFELTKLGIKTTSIDLGEIAIESELSADKKEALSNALKQIGFEILDDSKTKTIEKIKTEIIHLIHHNDNDVRINYSKFIEEKLKRDYNYLSNLFSEIEGTTIEKYIILQKIEKVKELLVYNQLSLSEIADQMGYSSVAYLSGQFKKVTGLTPSYFKTIKENKRKSLDKI
ncbi:MAG: helix-turn-helix transcriptional regulator [Bacteroidetes bacterium]|nr:helix-turn-helix transcriptional regulator [Bacteroidota bacterium]